MTTELEIARAELNAVEDAASKQFDPAISAALKKGDFDAVDEIRSQFQAAIASAMEKYEKVRMRAFKASHPSPYGKR
jgi:hypothetical protein